jgi:hypothetical protein
MFVGALCGLTLVSAAAQETKRPTRQSTVVRRAVPPTPPRRPDAPTPSQAEPTPAPMTELPPLDASLPPPSLPRAPRERMRLCATQWLKIRQDGQTNGTGWRDFATKCLTR